MIFIRL